MPGTKPPHFPPPFWSRYGPEPTIASVSLGARRSFVLRKKSDHSVKHRSVERLLSAHGTLSLPLAITIS